MGTKKSLTNLVLLSLEKTIDGYVRFEDYAYNSGRYAFGDGWQYPLKKSDLSLALKRLRVRGLIELVSEKEWIYRLTDDGKSKVLWEKLKQDKKWDNKWRIVIWDIPERKRVVRDLLRQKLKQLGFSHLQNSVWGSKKDCGEALRDFINRMGLNDWVKVFIANKLEI